MSYLVLARKYRPRTFSDMVGQEVTTSALRGAITENRIGHAYLFSGPRGTGKTTTARIFAKALNCEKGPTADPCGVCERCRAADDGSEIDIIEIDAASNTGVDNVRELRESATYSPLRARFKIYIIDEVHMLSKGAFNAFLKTLEEPPAHVKFLLATTDPQKVPETILSRCQLFRLGPIPEKVIAERLEHVFEREEIRAGPGVALEIARRARGGLRDALSLTDQLLSLVGDEPKLEDVVKLSAEGGQAGLERLIERLEARDRAGLLASLPRTEGGENELVAGLLDELRALLLVLVCGKDHPLVQAEPERRERLRVRAERIGLERMQVWLEELLMVRERAQRLPQHARLLLELALLDLCRPEVDASLVELTERLAALEARLARGGAPAPGAVAARPAPTAPTVPTVPSTTQASAPARPDVIVPAARPASPVRAANTAREQQPASDRQRPMIAGTADAWTRFLDALAKQSPSLAETLRTRGKLADLSSARAVIKLSNLREHEKALVFDARNQRLATQAFSELVGNELQLAFEDQSALKHQKDAFTGKVAELFDGRIEDEA